MSNKSRANSSSPARRPPPPVAKKEGKEREKKKAAAAGNLRYAVPRGRANSGARGSVRRAGAQAGSVRGQVGARGGGPGGGGRALAPRGNSGRASPALGNGECGGRPRGPGKRPPRAGWAGEARGELPPLSSAPRGGPGRWAGAKRASCSAEQTCRGCGGMPRGEPVLLGDAPGRSGCWRGGGAGPSLELWRSQTRCCSKFAFSLPQIAAGFPKLQGVSRRGVPFPFPACPRVFKPFPAQLVGTAGNPVPSPGGAGRLRAPRGSPAAPSRQRRQEMGSDDIRCRGWEILI